MEQNAFTKEQFKEVKCWLDASPDIPPDVKSCLMMLVDAALKGEKSTASATRDFHQLLVMFGIKPSTEKHVPQRKVPKDKPARSELDVLASKSRYQINCYHSVKNKLETDPMSTKNAEQWRKDFPEAPEANRQEVKRILDLSANESPEGIALVEQDLESRLTQGQGADPIFAAPEETIFADAPVQGCAQDMHFALSPETLQAVFGKTTGLQKETLESFRYDVSLQTIAYKITSETARDPQTGRSVSATPASLGPKGYQITTRALVNLVLLSVAFLLPLHRIERMLSSIPIFHRSNLCRYLGLMAELCLPVYLHLIRQLAQAEVLWADATPTRVNEVNRAFQKRREWELLQAQENIEGPPEPLPWETSLTTEQENCAEDENHSPTKEETETPKTRIWHTLKEELGYSFHGRRKNNPGRKQRHQTMVIHGRTDQNDPDSYTVIYRSCLGDVGNVLDGMLQNRAQSSPLFLQCDHSSANLPADEAIKKRVPLKVAGCLAHLRRPFKRYFDRDPERCDQILSLMFQVTHIEQQLKEKGRNKENILAVRRSWSAMYLEVLCHYMIESSKLSTWSDQTPLGKAARAFIKHFPRITLFCAHPHLEATNNRSERYLRGEKLSQGSSYFRDTMEGRARFDVLKSIQQTCISTKLPFAHYLLHILQANKYDIANHPEKFTPQAVKAALDSDTSLLAKYQRILAQGH